jgi:hypothetical protein
MHLKGYLPLSSNILIFQFGRAPDMVMVKPEALVPEHLEFPRFNYKFVGQKNQVSML